MGGNKTVFWSGISPDDPLYKSYLVDLKWVFDKGYSVIELMRMLGHRTAQRVYRDLLRVGAVPKLQRKRQPRYDIPGPVTDALKQADLSYLQWTNSHGVDPGLIEEGLMCRLSVDDEVSVIAHDMLIRDFPDVYFNVFGYIDIAGGRLVVRATNFPLCKNITVEYDAGYGAYIATSDEYPDIKGMGWTATASKIDFGRKYMLHQSTLALRRAPPHPGPLFKMRDYF